MTLIQKVDQRINTNQVSHYDVVHCSCGESFLYEDRFKAMSFKDRLLAEHYCLDKLISVTTLREYLICRPLIARNWLRTNSIYC